MNSTFPALKKISGKKISRNLKVSKMAGNPYILFDSVVSHTNKAGAPHNGMRKARNTLTHPYSTVIDRTHKPTNTDSDAHTRALHIPIRDAFDAVRSIATHLHAMNIH